MQAVRLYGVPFSQPVRAVMWLMLYKRLPFELVLINPGCTSFSDRRKTRRAASCGRRSTAWRSGFPVSRRFAVASLRSVAAQRPALHPSGGQ